MVEDVFSVGQRIKRIRDSLGLTQEEFRKKVHLSQSAISQYEQGERIPSSQALQSIAKGLGIQVSDLLDEENPKEPENSKDLLIKLVVAKLRRLPKEQIVYMDRSLNVLLDSQDDSLEEAR